ncbi:MAG: hypothetical protein L6Q97_19400 [Thermoanaerobaculia bacterium]|nr:hypothetical protein [Thermoanaerobaculia bacterium]
MNLSKAKIYLDKINRDFSRMSKEPDTILRIDVDIMLSHIRELYDALLSEDENSASPKAEAPRHKTTPARHPETPEPPAPVAAAPEPGMPAYQAPSMPQPAEPAPPPEEKPAPAPPPPPVIVESIKAAEPLPTIKIQAPPAATPPPSFPAISPEAEALFEQKQVTELSEKLSELPIPDLRKAIALNDRLLLTSELFGGDNQAFDNAINALNGFQRMEQAKAFLLDQCVMRYRWTEKKRAETAKNFIKLVRRRYS